MTDDDLEKYEAISSEFRLAGDSVTANAFDEIIAMEREARAEGAERKNAELLKLVKDAEKALEEAENALEGLTNFAWSAVRADCDASRDYLNSLINDARAALATIRTARGESDER